MIEAGKEEKQLAEENGDYYHGVPSITVIVDAIKELTSIRTMPSRGLGLKLVSVLESSYTLE